MKAWTWHELESGVVFDPTEEGWLPTHLAKRFTAAKWCTVRRVNERIPVGEGLMFVHAPRFACTRLMTAMYMNEAGCKRVLKMQPDELARFYQTKPGWAQIRTVEPLWAHLVGALYGDTYAAADALMHRVPCMAGMYRAVFDLPRLTRLTEMYAPDRATLKILFASVFNRTNPSRTQVAEWLSASYVAWSMNREVG